MHSLPKEISNIIMYEFITSDAVRRRVSLCNTAMNNYALLQISQLKNIYIDVKNEYKANNLILFLSRYCTDSLSDFIFISENRIKTSLFTKTLERLIKDFPSYRKGTMTITIQFGICPLVDYWNSWNFLQEVQTTLSLDFDSNTKYVAKYFKILPSMKNLIALELGGAISCGPLRYDPPKICYDLQNLQLLILRHLNIGKLTDIHNKNILWNTPPVNLKYLKLTKIPDIKISQTDFWDKIKHCISLEFIHVGFDKESGTNILSFIPTINIKYVYIKGFTKSILHTYETFVINCMKARNKDTIKIRYIFLRRFISGARGNNPYDFEDLEVRFQNIDEVKLKKYNEISKNSEEQHSKHIYYKEESQTIEEHIDMVKRILEKDFFYFDVQ